MVGVLEKKEAENKDGSKEVGERSSTRVKESSLRRGNRLLGEVDFPRSVEGATIHEHVRQRPVILGT